MKELCMARNESYKLRDIRLKRRKRYMSTGNKICVEKLTLSGREIYLLRASPLKHSEFL
jgi:hypothetical protein